MVWLSKRAYRYWVGPFHAAALLAASVLFAGAVAGCSMVAGLGEFVKDDCAGGGCEGGVDTGVPEASPTEAQADTNPGDTSLDTTLAETSTDASPDVSADVTEPPEASADTGSDAPDGGCTLNTPDNCGACGVKCDTVHSIGAVCAGGKCQYSGCDAGWGDCDTSGNDANGCETPTTTVNNCGACGSTCDTVHSLNASCPAPGSKCMYTGCVAGWLDCDTSSTDANGCESPKTSTTSCSACGDVCNTTTGAPSCNGTACSYACSAGKADCNMGTAPDLDGCECATATAATQGTIGGCCGSGCQVEHSNGVGGNYFDCVALSTFNLSQAQKAATSDTAQAGSITSGTCGTAPNTQSAVFKTAGNMSTGTCTGWVYAATGNVINSIGLVYASSGTGTDVGCFCPLVGNPPWS